jgi:2-methylcitrate dehydratase PrpD
MAQFVIANGYDGLPAEAVEATKRDILDTMGTALAGSAAPGCKGVLDMVRGWKGKPESTVLVFGDRAPAPHIALVNGTMAHALDFDDTHDKAVLHAGVTVIPAALAVAEQRRAVRGRDFINAVALGLEITCRLGLATQCWIGWMLTPLYGYFGATTAAAKLLNLGQEALLDAWGIAYAQASGNQECVPQGGALTKRLQAGLAAQGGVLSVLFTQYGITGAKTCFEGKAGLFPLYQRGEYDPSLLTSELGKRFEMANLSFKPYPCCRWLHSSIDAALKLVSEYHLKPEQIEAVRVGASRTAIQSVGEPVELKRFPQNVVDAQFSIHYAVANALVKGKVGIDHFSLEGIKDTSVRQMTPRVVVEVDEKIERRSGREISGAEVTVTTVDGRTITATVDRPRGDPDNPMTNEELTDKFRDCASHSAKPLSPKNLDSAINALLHLEEVPDISDVIRRLVG